MYQDANEVGIIMVSYKSPQKKKKINNYHNMQHRLTLITILYFEIQWFIKQVLSLFHVVDKDLKNSRSSQI